VEAVAGEEGGLTVSLSRRTHSAAALRSCQVSYCPNLRTCPKNSTP